MNKSHYWTLGLVAAGLAVVALALLLVAPQLVRAGTHDVGVGGNIQGAIYAASPGDTIRVQAGTFNESLQITKSLTLEGGYDGTFASRNPRDTILNGASPVVDISGAGVDVTVDGFEITGGSAPDGGGIYVDVDTDSRVVIHDNFIHDNNATDDGGGIYADVEVRSDLEITDNDVMSNTTTAGGGHNGAGIYAENMMSGTLVMSGNNINYNASGNNYGGFYAYVDYFGQFTIEDNVVMSNTATTASTDDYGGFYFAAEDNSHGTFDRNQVIGNRASDDYGGGKVYIAYNSSATFYDNEFRGNAANGTGSSEYYGGLYLDVEYHSQVTGDNLKVVDNISGNYYGGGYVYAYANSSAILPHTRITGNDAGSDYGGMRFKAYDHCTIEVPNLYVYDNRALGGDVGGVYLDADDGQDTVIATNAQVISNTASSDGGGVYVYADDGGLVDLTGSLFERNEADYGGGLYVSDIEEGSTLLLGHTEFLTNTAASSGGGAYFEYGPTYGSYLELSYAEFISNTAETGDGGGFYMDEFYYNVMSEVSIQADHLTFLRNRAADYGGAFYLEDAYEGSGKLIFDDGVYKDNTAGDYGGAVYFEYCYDGCYLTMSRNLFEDNEATASDGGAVYFYEAYQGSEVHFDDNKFYDNEAGGDGGAFFSDYFAEDGAVGTFDRNELTGNTAGDEGGAVYIYDFAYYGGVTSFNENVVKGNRSGGDGGGVYLYYPAYGGSRAEFKDNVIVGNVISSTSDYDGGGLYVYEVDEGSILWMTGNVITGNLATGYGGGLYWDDDIDYGSVVYFEDNLLNDNYAGEDGGGCYFEGEWEYGNRVYFNNNEVNRNVAEGDYGGCYICDIYEGTVVDMKNNQFNDNSAGEDFGALYVQHVSDGSVLTFWDNEVIGNRAGMTDTQVLGGDGGGLWLDDIYGGSIVDMRRNTILSNTAYLSGTTGGEYAGMYAYVDRGGWLKMGENLIAANTAQDSYAGLSVEMDGSFGADGSRLTMIHNTIQANKAITESGGLYIYGEDDSRYLLRRNRIVGNQAATKGGLWIENGDTTNPLSGILKNNLIAGNLGSGLYLYDADLDSTNDTIADNPDYGIMMSGTLTTTAWLSNTILWGNTSAFTSSHPTTQTMVATYSDIEGGWPGTGNINQDPLFVNAAAGDYHLQATSPAVDQVAPATAPPIDLEGIPRPVPAGGQADMGAFEWFRAGVTLAPDRASTEDPGTVAAYDLTVTNDGNVADTFLLDVPVNPLGWTVAVVPPTVSLNPGASATVQVNVTVPAMATAGTLSQMTVRATSQSDGAVQDIAAIDTTVALVPAVSLEPDREAGGTPGVVVYEHTLTNLSNGSEAFLLTASSSEGWSVSVQPAAVTLAQGGTATVKVFVSVPAGAAPGTVDVTTVTATSQSDAAVSDTATDSTTREAFPYGVYLPLLYRASP